MNKAFTKELDPTDGFCPRCGGHGIEVARDTVITHLQEDKRTLVGDAAFFCSTPHCEIVYFDLFDRVAGVEALRAPVYPKDADAPMCGCFGFGREEIEADIEEGVVSRTRALVEKSRSPLARCGIASVSGQCCVPEIQRYFLKRRAAVKGESSPTS